MNTKRRCPKHNNYGVVPTDMKCHNHRGNIHQWLHNTHCRQLKCPFAKRGNEKHEDTPVIMPRNWIEKLIDLFDRSTEWRKNIYKLLNKK